MNIEEFLNFSLNDELFPLRKNTSVRDDIF